MQNLGSLTLKTKELWKGVENTSQCYTSQKSPVLIGLIKYAENSSSSNVEYNIHRH